MYRLSATVISLFYPWNGMDREFFQFGAINCNVQKITERKGFDVTAYEDKFAEVTQEITVPLNRYGMEIYVTEVREMVFTRIT
jgi:hypothetical protein